MAWSSAFNSQSKHIELTISGEVSHGDLIAACDSAFKLALEHGTQHVLADCRLMKGGHSVPDLYFLAKKLAGNAELMPEFREAVVLAVDPGARAMVHFWETTCLNRGLNVRVFEDRQYALQWLHETAGAATA